MVRWAAPTRGGPFSLEGLVTTHDPDNPFTAFTRHQGVVVLDGGIATTLETLGCDLDDDLWSAKILLENPDAVRRVHSDFLHAGADCITTCTYQASIPGFVARGLSEDEAVGMMGHAVKLATEARDAFWSDTRKRDPRLRPLVAAGIGPYGAYRADGSEYTGAYDVGSRDLHTFHERRWSILAGSPADLLACETIPCLEEAIVLLELLKRTPDRWAWMSFSCRDEAHLCDGTPLGHAVELCDVEPRIAAIGVNCTEPSDVPGLITTVRQATQKPIIVYPNAGGTWDAIHRTWTGDVSHLEWPDLATQWRGLGATVIGGCCRVSPDDISQMRDRLLTA